MPGMLRVYIEGDGHAWKSLTQPSRDPTPHNAVGLQLALADPSKDAILYLARPCQYSDNTTGICSNNKYWTRGRMSETVVANLDEAISQIKQRCGAESLALVGYSGGGGLAVLLASRREDVSFLGTIAGTLDIEAWTALHQVSPLEESLNPLDNAFRIKTIRQMHLSSTADSVMPPSISRSFCERMGRPEACRIVTGMAHGSHWETVWNYAYSD